MNENDILTTLDLAHEWGVERHVAQRRAKRLEKRLDLKRVLARSPSGQTIFAYSRSDADRIFAAEREREERRKTNASRKIEKATEIQYEIGTSNRSDVMTVHELAKRLNIGRLNASQLARRHEGQLGIQRVKARAASTQEIVAYKRSDGERLISYIEEERATKIARQNAKEKRKREREAIPQPRAPSSRNELFYLIELRPGMFKIGWTSDIEQRQRNHRTTNPDLRLVKSWPCKRKRDRMAMDFAFSFPGLQKTGRELFETQDIQAFVRHLDQFFDTPTDKCT